MYCTTQEINRIVKPLYLESPVDSVHGTVA